MRVAYYFGSFNPIHNGHLRLIEKALEEEGIDVIVVVPAMHNPFKDDIPIDIDERKNLIEKALLNHKNITLYKRTIIDDIEKKLEPPYYTYNTLKALDEKYRPYPGEKYIICGQDMKNEIYKWYKGQEILKEYKFIVCPRTKESSTEVRDCVKNNNINKLNELIPNSLINNIITIYE